jgi:hypothetical protein
MIGRECLWEQRVPIPQPSHKQVTVYVMSAMRLAIEMFRNNRTED